MSKKNEATQIVTPETLVVSMHKHNYPKDGSQADKAIADLGNVSKAIRELCADGYSRGEVAKILNKRYQHVRNVMITPVKKTA